MAPRNFIFDFSKLCATYDDSVASVQSCSTLELDPGRKFVTSRVLSRGSPADSPSSHRPHDAPHDRAE
eukprot:6768151-Prymnesium_polylepis.2